MTGTTITALVIVGALFTVASVLSRLELRKLWRDLESKMKLINTLIKERDDAYEQINQIAMQTARATAKPIFTIQKANWGNFHSRTDISDIIRAMPLNALTFHVDPHVLKSDPAPGIDEKYIEVTYQFPGRPPETIRRMQHQWIVLPVDPLQIKQFEEDSTGPLITIEYGPEPSSGWGTGLILTNHREPAFNLKIRRL